jgi:hypothetical protein
MTSAPPCAVSRSWHDVGTLLHPIRHLLTKTSRVLVRSVSVPIHLNTHRGIMDFWQAHLTSADV